MATIDDIYNLLLNTRKHSTLDESAGIHQALGAETATAGKVLTANGTGQATFETLPTTGLQFQGLWNANTNTPALASGVGTQGYFYIVSVAGATNLDGITDWQVNDWAVFTDIVWVKIDNTDLVTSVNTKTGAVVLNIDDINPLTTKGDVLTHNNTNHVRLPVGTDNQFIIADSTAPNGIKWADAVNSVNGDTGTVTVGAGDVSPLTTKGDIWGYSTADDRIPVGTNNQALVADSTQGLGVKWANIVNDVNGSTGSVTINSATVSPLTTKGDLWTYSTANIRLGVGTDNQLLFADSTQPSGLAWDNLSVTNLGGSGEGILSGFVGRALQAKKLIAGTNITLTPDANSITIDASGGGGGSGPATHDINTTPNAVPTTNAQLETRYSSLIDNSAAGGIGLSSGISFRSDSAAKAYGGIYLEKTANNEGKFYFSVSRKDASLNNWLTVLPYDTTTTAFGSVIFGDRLTVSNPQIGSNNEAFGSGALANNSTGTRSNNTVFGKNATSLLGNSNVVMGYNIAGGGAEAVIIGSVAQGSTQMVSVGYNAQAFQNLNVAIGRSAIAFNPNGITIGGNASNSGTPSVAIGCSIGLVANDSILIGDSISGNSQASTIMIGKHTSTNNRPLGTNNVIIGNVPLFPNTDNIGIGNNLSFGSFSDCFLVGRQATATASEQVVIGSSAQPMETIMLGRGFNEGNPALTTTITTSNANVGNQGGGHILRVAAGNTRGNIETFGEASTGGKVVISTSNGNGTTGVNNPTVDRWEVTTKGFFRAKNQRQYAGDVSGLFRKLFEFEIPGLTTYNSEWISNGTNPNGNLSSTTHGAAVGDICRNADSGKMYYMSATPSTWTAM